MNILQYLNRVQIDHLGLFSVLLAASAHNRCTSLVCSCYVAARNSYSNDEESIRSSSSRNNQRKQQLESCKDGTFEGRFCSADKLKSEMSTFNGDYSGSKANSPNCIEPMPLKSNLKKTATMEISQLRIETRKVSWPDSQGKDIAHIQEFEPSVSEDGELKSVGNSCICVIQ